MRRDSYQLHISNSSSLNYRRHYQCPIMSRLYTAQDDDTHVSRDGDISSPRAGVRFMPAAELMDSGDSGAVCDDVFCMSHEDDHHQHRLFHAWAQYRIAQRGIMVSFTAARCICYLCSVGVWVRNEKCLIQNSMLCIPFSFSEF